MTKKTDEYQTIRIWRKTHKLLKTLAAMQGDSLIMLLNRLAEDELQRMKEGQGAISTTIDRSRSDEDQVQQVQSS